MRIRQIWLVLAMLSIPTIASADGHRAGFGGPSIRSGSVLFGVHAAFDIALPKQSVAIGGDFSWYSDDQNSTTAALAIRLLPGYSIKSTRRQFVGLHALAGVHKQGESGLALGFGGSYEVVLTRTPAGNPFLLRIQLDAITPEGEPDAFGRLSFLFGGRW